MLDFKKIEKLLGKLGYGHSVIKINVLDEATQMRANKHNIDLICTNSITLRI